MLNKGKEVRVPLGEEDETKMDTLARKTPWWVLSTGFHFVVLLTLSFLIVLGQAPEDLGAVVITRTPLPSEIENAPELPENNQKPIDIDKSEELLLFEVKDDAPETPNEEEFEKAKGVSLDNLVCRDMKNDSVYDVIGTGGGAAGPYGERFGGNKLKGLNDGGGGKKTDGAVLMALKWLARHQNPDGSWSATGYTARCTSGNCSPNPGAEEHTAGITGLSLLAFLGAGYTHLSREKHEGIDFGRVVRKGLEWIKNQQNAEGRFGLEIEQYMYNHAVCTLAMGEAYGMTRSILFEASARRGIEFLVAAQNHGKAWRYTSQSGDNDTSVTGWAVMALKSAELAKLPFPQSAYEGAQVWLSEVTDPNYGSVGYTARGTGQVVNDGNKHFDNHEALTAIGMMCRSFMNKKRNDPMLAHGAHLLMKDLPQWEGNAIDFYYWYNASLALFQYYSANDANWKKWNDHMKAAIVGHQNQKSSGCRRGSWEPVGRWCNEGGRVYATAINCLTLEVYYRYANAFVGK